MDTDSFNPDCPYVATRVTTIAHSRLQRLISLHLAHVSLVRVCKIPKDLVHIIMNDVTQRAKIMEKKAHLLQKRMISAV